MSVKIQIIALIFTALSMLGGTIVTIVLGTWYLANLIQELKVKVEKHDKWLHDHLIDLGSDNPLGDCDFCHNHNKKLKGQDDNLEFDKSNNYPKGA